MDSMANKYIPLEHLRGTFVVALGLKQLVLNRSFSISLICISLRFDICKCTRTKANRPDTRSRQMSYCNRDVSKRI